MSVTCLQLERVTCLQIKRVTCLQIKRVTRLQLQRVFLSCKDGRKLLRGRGDDAGS